MLLSITTVPSSVQKQLDMFNGCEGREFGSLLLTKLGNEKEGKKET